MHLKFVIDIKTQSNTSQVSELTHSPTRWLSFPLLVRAYLFSNFKESISPVQIYTQMLFILHQSCQPRKYWYKALKSLSEAYLTWQERSSWRLVLSHWQYSFWCIVPKSNNMLSLFTWLAPWPCFQLEHWPRLNMAGKPEHFSTNKSV